MFCKKDVLINFTKFTGKHLCQSLFFNKVAALRPATLLKAKLWHRCFPVNFTKFLRTHFFIEHVRWLLLDMAWGNKIPVFIFEVNGTEINFEFKLSKSTKISRGSILVFWWRLIFTKSKKKCSSRGLVFANFLSIYFRWPKNFRVSMMVSFHKETNLLIIS